MSKKGTLWAAGIVAVGYILGSWISAEISKTSGDPLVDKWIKRLRNHPATAPVLMIFIAIIAIATVLVSIRSILEFYSWFIEYLNLKQ